MVLAKGSKALLIILGLAYLVFIAIFMYQSVAEQGLVSVPAFETGQIALPETGGEKALQEFADRYVRVEIATGEGNTGKYRVVQMRPQGVKKLLGQGTRTILGTDKSQAAKAQAFAKKRYMAAANIKSPEGVIVLKKATEIGLMQIELLTTHGVAGKEKIPVQGHGAIIGINATMAFVILNFFILVALLYGLLWEPITRMLDERTASVRRDIEHATASREDAEKLKLRYEQAIANARTEASRMKQEKVRDGEAQKEKIIRNARDEAKRLAEDAKLQIDAAVLEAKGELRKEVGDISVEIAKQILGKEVNKEIHRNTIDEFLRNLETESV